jgi:hypothetical protein
MAVRTWVAAMSDMPPGLPKHPIGTFAFVGAYAPVPGPA